MINERITGRDVDDYKREILEQTVLVEPKVAAKMLSCSERTVFNLASEGEFHGYNRNRGGKGMRFLASELRDYVNSIKIDKDWWRE